MIRRVGTHSSHDLSTPLPTAKGNDKMESIYTPPHLRRRSKPAAVSDAPSALIATPSAPPSLNPQEQSDDDLYTIQEIHDYFWGDRTAYPDGHSATLQSSAYNPNELSWVLLFNDANSKWCEDGIMFIKRNLKLLSTSKSAPKSMPVVTTAALEHRSDEPNEDGGVMLPTNSEAADEDHSEGPSDETPEPTTTEPLFSQPSQRFLMNYSPIAVFSQSNRCAGRSFRFIGWYKIDLQALEPGSLTLIGMVMDKWEAKDEYGNTVLKEEGPSNWMESSYPWAVARMKKDEEAMRSMGEPEIERTEDNEGMTEESERQSFNEMLAKMRLEGKGKVVAPEEEET